MQSEQVPIKKIFNRTKQFQLKTRLPQPDPTNKNTKSFVGMSQSLEDAWVKTRAIPVFNFPNLKHTFL